MKAPVPFLHPRFPPGHWQPAFQPGLPTPAALGLACEHSARDDSVECSQNGCTPMYSTCQQRPICTVSPIQFATVYLVSVVWSSPQLPSRFPPPVLFIFPPGGLVLDTSSLSSASFPFPIPTLPNFSSLHRFNFQRPDSFEAVPGSLSCLSSCSLPDATSTGRVGQTACGDGCRGCWYSAERELPDLVTPPPSSLQSMRSTPRSGPLPSSPCDLGRIAR